MRIVSRKALREFSKTHPDAEASLDAWYRIAKRADWNSLTDTRIDFPHADLVGVCTVFNIKGNHYRLIGKIYYDHGKLLIRQILTHRDYDRGRWKNDCIG